MRESMPMRVDLDGYLNRMAEEPSFFIKSLAVVGTACAVITSGVVFLIDFLLRRHSISKP